MATTLAMLVLIASIVSIGPSKAEGQVVIDPRTPTGPVVERWGWDLKGDLGRLNTTSKARSHYRDADANLLRIPFFVDAHFSNGIVDTNRYSRMLTSIQNVIAENPDTEVFASLKLLGGDTFIGPDSDPDWVTAGTAAWPFDSGGTIFGNQSNRPNPEHYSQLVADYVSFLDGHNISIDYLGVNNETDGALGVSRYIETVDLVKSELTTRGINTSSIQFIGPDTFSPTTAVNITNNLATENRLDTAEIIGSHYYYGHGNHTRDRWVSMSQASGGQDLWFTEAHINSSNSNNGDSAIRNITRMRNGMAMVFSANAAGDGAVDAQGDLIGASSFVWWGGGGDDNSIDDVIKREIINTMIDGQPVATTPGFIEQTPDDDSPLYQAYVQDNRLNVWIANPADEEMDFSIDLAAGRLLDNANSAPTGTYWQGCESATDCHGTFGNTINSDSTGSLTFDVSVDKSGLTIDHIPFNSVALLSFDLAASGDLNGDSALTNDDLLTVCIWMASPIGLGRHGF